MLERIDNFVNRLSPTQRFLFTFGFMVVYYTGESLALYFGGPDAFYWAKSVISSQPIGVAILLAILFFFVAVAVFSYITIIPTLLLDEQFDDGINLQT